MGGKVFLFFLVRFVFAWTDVLTLTVAQRVLKTKSYLDDQIWSFLASAVKAGILIVTGSTLLNVAGVDTSAIVTEDRTRIHRTMQTHREQY